MHTIDHPQTRVYYIAHDSGTILAFGYVEPNQRLDSGAPGFELYQTEEALNLALATTYGVINPDVSIEDDNPNVPLGIRKAVLCARVNKIRAEKLSLPVMFAGHLFDTDEAAMTNIIGVLTAINAKIPVPPGFTWRSHENVNVPVINRAWLAGLAGTILAYRNKCYTASWSLKAKIESAADPLAINLLTEWPDNTNPTA